MMLGDDARHVYNCGRLPCQTWSLWDRNGNRRRHTRSQGMKRRIDLCSWTPDPRVSLSFGSTLLKKLSKVAAHRLQDRSRLLHDVRLQASWQAFGLSDPSARECSACSVRRGGTSHHDTRSRILSVAVHERLILAVPYGIPLRRRNRQGNTCWRTARTSDPGVAVPVEVQASPAMITSGEDHE